MQMIVFLTRHYPPNKNVNGESVWDLAKYLIEERNIKVHVICCDVKTKGGGAPRNPIGEVTRIQSLYSGKFQFLKHVSSLLDGYRLAKKALALKPALIIATTSPPLLPFWCGRLFKNFKQWGVWQFDLFPEYFHLQNVVNKNSKLFKFLKQQTYSTKPNFFIGLGPKQVIHIKSEYNSEIDSIVLPCGLFYTKKNENKPVWYDGDKIQIGYAGNIAAPHNEDLIKAAIDEIRPESQKLILALFGEKSEDLKGYAKGKKGIQLVNGIPRDHLSYIDIHLVSLKREYTHICVPSKAISAICSNSALIFCGDASSDNWYLLKDSGWIIDENSNIRSQIKKLFSELNPLELTKKKIAAVEIQKKLNIMLENAYSAIGDLYEKL